MKEVAHERFRGLPQAFHSRLNVHAGSARAHSIQWIVLDGRQGDGKDEHIQGDCHEDR
jgi:hypothetical protein